MSGRQRLRRQIVRSEEFALEVMELMTLARDRGEALRREREEQQVEDPASPRPKRTRLTAEYLGDELRQLLEDEYVPAYTEDEEFVQSEFHREVVKKALIGLRAETLRKVAEEHSLDKRGAAEDVAERIARAYRYDDAEIARLILDNVEEPTAEAGHESRVFPLVRNLNINGAEARLQQVDRRLVRTGVARWLSVDHVERIDDQSLGVEGRLRSYKAFVDELGDAPTLRSSPDEKDVRVILRDCEPRMTTEEASVNVSRVCARAVSDVIDVPLTAGLPIGRAHSGHLATMDDRTVLLLDLVHSRLTEVGIADRNLTVARFVTEKADRLASTAPDEAQEHSLKAVRFEGNHLLDSPQACQLISLQGRGLVDISLWIAAPDLAEDGGLVPWFPVRFTVERDHVGVLTGFGRHRPERSAQLHRRLVEQVEAALEHGLLDEGQLNEFAEQISRVAVSGEPGSGLLSP